MLEERGGEAGSTRPEDAGALGGRDRGAGRARGALVAVLAVNLAFACWLAAVQQVRVVVVTERPGVVVLDDGVRRELPSKAGRADLAVTLEHADGGEVAVSRLRTGGGAWLSDASQYGVTGDFAFDDPPGDGTPWRSLSAGSTLSWQGRVAGLSATATCSAGAGVLCTSGGSDPERRCVDLSACEGTVALSMPSPRTVHHGLVPLWRSHFQLEAPAGAVRSVRWALGSTVLGELRPPATDTRVEVALPLSTRLGAVLRHVAGGLGQLLEVLWVVALLLLAGSVVVTPFVDRLGLLEALLLSFFAGEALTSNLVTALFYAVRAQVAVGVVMVLLLAVAVAQLSRGGAARWAGCATRGWATDRGPLAWLSVVALLAALAFFFPLLPFPGWFVGHGLTDSVDYAAWASVTRDGPLDRSLEAVRYQDYVRVSLTGLLSGADTTRAYGAEALRAWLVWPFLVFALLRRLGLVSAAALLGAALAANANGFVEVFTQCYLPHYEVVHFAVAGLWATAWFVQEGALLPGRARRWAEVGLGAVLAASVGLYPYQAFSVLGFGGVWLVAGLARRSLPTLLTLGRVVLVVVAIANVNLEIVFDFNQGSMKHRDSLNAIGRNVVFPWYSQPAAVAILAGTEDFSQQSALGDAFAAELFAGFPRGARAFALAEAAVAPVVPVATWTLLGCALASLGWLVRRRRALEGWVALATLALPAALSASLMLRGDVYFWVKSLMTLSALAVVPAVGVLAGLAAARSRVLGLLGSVLAVVLVLAWVRAGWFDQLVYYANRESSVVDRGRNHLSPLDDSFASLQGFLRQLPPGQRFVILDRLNDAYRTDDDIVTYNRLLALLEGHSVHYGAGASRRYTRTRHIEYSGTEPLERFGWAVQFDRCAGLPVPSTVVLETNALCVRRLGAAP